MTKEKLTAEELDLIKGVLGDVGIEMSEEDIEKAMKKSDMPEEEEEIETTTEEDEDEDMDMEELKKSYKALKKSFAELAAKKPAEKPVEKSVDSDIEKAINGQLGTLNDLIKGLTEKVSELQGEVERVKNETPAPKSFGINAAAIIEKAESGIIGNDGKKYFHPVANKTALQNLLLDELKFAEGDIRKSISHNIGTLSCGATTLTEDVKDYLRKKGNVIVE